MKQIAVICNYKLEASRIGGMDRFFVAYDRECKKQGYMLKWFFPTGEPFDFYTGLDIEIAEKKSLENCFLEAHHKNSFDIVITHFIELCTSFFKKVKDGGEPYIIAVDHNPRPLNGFPFKKRIKNRLKGRLYSRYIDRFIGVSKYTKDHILKDYGKNLASKTQVIYNGVACEEYHIREEVNHGKFIVASHLRASKGVQDLILAVSLLNVDLKQKLFIDIFGKGPMQAELEAMVQRENLEDQIRFRGSSPELPKLFKNYSFLLQPTYMECFSLSILESLAANVPVITTPVGGNPEVIVDGQNGFIYETGNIQQLSDIIQKVLRNIKGIQHPVHPLVQENYYLEKMVCEHAALLNL